MINFPMLDETIRINRLTPPSGRVSVVLDTDTYNEIDDQFALVYAMLSREQLDLQAVYAAPFHNNRSNGPGDGMERSYEEILRVFDRLGDKPDGLVFRGSTSYLPGPDTAVESPAVADLIARAESATDAPLYVLAVGAITNVASAILLKPAIVENIVVVWLGGNPQLWPNASEFNLKQDVHASRLMFDCGVPFVHIPCVNVAEHLRTTLPEVQAFARGRGAIGDYLCEIYQDYFPDHYARSKVIWDISAVAWVLNPGWVQTVLVHSPILTDQLTWSHNPTRHFIREANRVDRDAIFGDLFRKLEHMSA